MSSSLLRGLTALEMVGAEALGVSEIARRLGVDKAGVSRMLGQLHDEGWVLRTGSRYTLGERALGMVSGDIADLRRRAARDVAALHASTGLTALVLRLAGDGAQPVAVAGPADFLDPDEPFEHLWSTAGGIALLAQLADSDLDRRLSDAGTWSAPSAAAPQGPDAVRALAREVRAGGVADERDWSIPGVGCTALPWPVLDPGPPYAVLVQGSCAALDRDTEGVRRALRDCVA